MTDGLTCGFVYQASSLSPYRCGGRQAQWPHRWGDNGFHEYNPVERRIGMPDRRDARRFFTQDEAGDVYTDLPPEPLVEDEDGAPYPEEVQRAFRLDVDRLAQALHNSRFHARYHNYVDEQDRTMARDLADIYKQLSVEAEAKG